MYRIETTRQFDEDLGKLDRAVAQRVIHKVEWLARHPETIKLLFERKEAPGIKAALVEEQYR